MVGVLPEHDALRHNAHEHLRRSKVRASLLADASLLLVIMFGSLHDGTLRAALGFV